MLETLKRSSKSFKKKRLFKQKELINKLSRKRLVTINDPTLVSNMSSIYEPHDFRESIDMPSEMSSPKIFRVSVNKWEELQQREDDFKFHSSTYSPTYKSYQKTTFNDREFLSDIDPWKTLDMNPTRNAKSPARINSFHIKEPKNNQAAIDTNNVEEQVIRYIENLEMQNIELENKIKALEEQQGAI
jgi:hypothetical protein